MHTDACGSDTSRLLQCIQSCGKIRMQSYFLFRYVYSIHTWTLSLPRAATATFEILFRIGNVIEMTLSACSVSRIPPIALQYDSGIIRGCGDDTTLHTFHKLLMFTLGTFVILLGNASAFEVALDLARG
jgi:hypothetical protein